MTRSELLALPVGTIMSQWPSTIGVFIAFRMHCIGCPIGMFHKLDDAADEHSLVLEELVEAIEAAVVADEAAIDAPSLAHRL